MICIYHNRDLDGYCSAAIVKKWHDEINDYPDNAGKGILTLIGYDYGQRLPFDESALIGEHVIMVDVSFPMEKMFQLSVLPKSFVYIDHHISAIKEFNERQLGVHIKPVFDDKISACEGTWKYLFPDKEIPEAVKLLGEYDTWRNENKTRWKDVLYFQWGMREICNSAETFPRTLLAEDAAIAMIINNGNVILSYQGKQNQKACASSAFETMFEGYRAICLNGGGFNSQTFESVYDEAKHDIMMPFIFSKDHWTVSIYTTKDIDCSVLAKSRGGGGHKKAAGFQTKDINSVFPINL